MTYEYHLRDYHPPTPRGLHVSPPNWKKYGEGWHILADQDDLTTCWAVLRSVDPSSRRRRGLAAQVERELLRSCVFYNVPVRVGIRDRGMPYFYFHKLIAEDWLNNGGRAWILAEIAARAGRDVIPFPRRPY